MWLLYNFKRNLINNLIKFKENYQKIDKIFIRCILLKINNIKSGFENPEDLLRILLFKIYVSKITNR